MELRQLKYFEKAAELLNFTEAAKTLFISQSTLSQQIKQLEGELGILLFDRIGKRVVLTEAGTSFLPYVRNTIRAAENGKQIIRDLQGIETGVLRIGVSYSLGSLLNKALQFFSEKHPKIKVEITFSTSDELNEMLLRNQADFILSLESQGEYSQFEIMPLFTSNLHLIVHCSHKLSRIASVTLRELAKIPLILPAKGFITRSMLDRAFYNEKLEPTVNIELNDVHSILTLVSSGHWGTMLTLPSVKDEQGFVAIPVCTDEDLSTRASLFWAQGSYRKKSAVIFAEILAGIINRNKYITGM